MPGFLFRARDPRLGERLAEGSRFTSVWPTSPALAPLQAALLSAGGQAFDAIAVMTRGRTAATYMWHITFDPVLSFDAEIELEEFSELLSNASQQALVGTLDAGGGQLADDLFGEILAAIVEARPDAAEYINRIKRLIEEAPPLNRRSDDNEPIVLYEADAVALALEIVGLDRNRELQGWAGTPRAPFLDGIEEFRVSEEQLIDHDARHFGDWEIVRDALVGGVTFSSPRGRHLTVMNVNKEPIERTLGVDLIYYNHDFDCYVLVQYKRMQQGNEDAEFRPDEQLEAELARMRAIVLDNREPADTDAYRLDHHCCYLKLCWPTTREFHAGEIVKGLYFPLAYWDLLVQSPVAVGPRGGVRLLGDTIGRRLHRTAFVGLVQDAWIGSRGLTTKAIETVIRSGLDANRSLILAAGRTR